ncbi:Nin one binding Zn-ribbon like-domain-containing protein [Radiomyces spectabilis]|uniref:Nin one binding Zn-ribbon like-domain-containing protein n=1 Tax=Radiomyces spectabilis TaxID=64574 RepID=UPI00221FA7DA|nr:Nin one binding Zn-ribbon like-domain-containing protein [Radiomyces spectabilis]KAI8375994.1 Nin one binding Zn-ribbon like-domain-containing protein [Radiomyces spectabilis]
MAVPQSPSTDNPVSAKKNQKVKYLVIDTNAIINGMTLRNVAEQFYTVPEVLVEARSAHSREFLTRLPFEIQVEEAPEASYKAVLEFSKLTGDYASLSVPDLKVLALAHSLEVKVNGHDNIRKEPVKPRPIGALPTAPPPKPKYIPKKALAEPVVDEDGWEQATTKKKYRKPQHKAPSTPSPAPASPAPAESTVASEKASDAAKESSEPSVAEITEKFNDVEIIVGNGDEEDDSDDGDWITPDNVDEFKATELGVTPEELRNVDQLDVACVTSDFAMQNVLLQMNLNLVSAGGHRISKIKNWVLRCHACFAVTSDMEKKFCPKCGNASLQRVSCSTNSKGEIAYHLKRNYKYNLRGTKYDIPVPKGGRTATNIVLREDQREYIKAKQSQSKKTVVDMFDPDFIPLYGKMDLRTTNNNMFGTDVIGFGRKNPNTSRRRTGKKKKHSP